MEWPNTQPINDDVALFAGTAGTVSVSRNVYLNALRFETPAYQIESTGGALVFVGSDPRIDVTLSSGRVTIAAPLSGAGGLTLTGNSQSGGLKFLVLANADLANPNTFSGPLTIAESGALRLGGGAASEQIPDDVDLQVAGVVDFITSGGASDGKREMVRNVSVTGPLANFSIGNGATFVVNSMTGTATAGPGIAVNGNNASVPGQLSITGWADGCGQLILNDGLVRVNTTSATAAIGGRISLAGDLTSRGNSEVSNKNGGGLAPEFNDFTNRAFDFTGTYHTIDVVDGTLKFTSASTSRPLTVNSTNPDGTVLVKMGAGVWLWENAVETSFVGTNRIEAGTWRMGAPARLNGASQLEIAGGELDLQGFSESVGGVLLAGGTINGTTTASLISGTDFQAESGSGNVALLGSVGLVKSTRATVVLSGSNRYTGTTTVNEGLLIVNGEHTGGGAYNIACSGVLGGTGTIDETVIVDGRVAPGPLMGTLTVGDVEFRSNSRLQVELVGHDVGGLKARHLTIARRAELHIAAPRDFVPGVYVVGQYASRAGEFRLHAPSNFAVEYNDSLGLILLIARPK